MAYATITDVSTRLGPPISDLLEIAQVTAWISDVEAAIAARFLRAGLVLADRVTAGAPSTGTLIRVEAEAVIRRIFQPLPGRTSTTRSVDDASVTDRWEGQTADGWLTMDDWGDLLPVGTAGGAFSTRPGFEPVATGPTVAWLCRSRPTASVPSCVKILM